MSAEPIDQVIELLKQADMGREGLSLEDRRASMDAMSAAFGEPQGVSRDNIELAGRPAQVFKPEGKEPEHTLLYFHGGGYVMGSPNSHANLTARFATAADARVISFDYRLAPENPFPAAVEDGVAAYKALLDEGVSPAKLAVGGDSAGGGLTFATLLKARDMGLPMPAAAIGLSPWTDLTGRSETYKTRADADPMIEPAGIIQTGEEYLGGASADDPLASPLLADLKGLPPLFLQVGDAEVLLDDSREFEKKARAAGVDCKLEVWDRMIHVWHAFFPMLPEGEQAIDGLSAFLKVRWRQEATAQAI
ncbi:MAG: alpha/beta hydrolase [Parvibaculaceae bacterium]|nr:alpha/beta hydrolase [Parvibaculaceae bacterium]